MDVPPNSIVQVCPTGDCPVWYWITPAIDGAYRCPTCGAGGEVIYRTGDADSQASAADAA